MAIREIPIRSGKIEIDPAKCGSCRDYPCVKACSLIGRSLFRVQDNKPELISSAEEAGRNCIECLACELYCRDYGNKGLKIDLDMFGLDEYRHKAGLSQRKRVKRDGHTGR